MAPITRLLILANVAVFLAQIPAGDAMMRVLALWPVGQYSIPELGDRVGFHVWQLVTSGFMHGGLAHIGLNMYALYAFGNEVERAVGPRYFLALYFGAMLTGSLIQLAVVTLAADAGVYPTVGASGAVFGVLLAFGLLFPHRTLVLLFPPIPMPAFLFVILYGILELINGVFGTEAGIAHFAHLGGMLGGFLVLWFWWAKESGNSGFAIPYDD